MARSRSQIDSYGFRANVAIVLFNEDNRVFWAKRVGMDAWQFPQGGVRPDESVEDAMYRELYEEVGLLPEHVEVVGVSRNWLRYKLPKRYIRRHSTPLCIGQKQRWYLLKLTGDESNVNLASSRRPEFDHWRWVDYSEPARNVVFFKRDVYRRALAELKPLMKTG
ncbi:MAG: RNA pyrophosphohydrolase [Gammaproteobacteria bacterium]|nr:RNA pyrophosphohydrolase [Gammaproteobacteria bacterium]